MRPYLTVYSLKYVLYYRKYVIVSLHLDDTHIRPGHTATDTLFLKLCMYLLHHDASYGICQVSQQ